MEVLLILIPIYVLISLVAFYKWLRLSVEVETLKSEIRKMSKHTEKAPPNGSASQVNKLSLDKY